MLKAITEWMNGDYAGKTMLVLRFLFFVLFIVTSFSVCFGSGVRKKGGENRFAILSAIAVLALAAIFAYQLVWQLFGTRNIEMVRFIRRHNHRASVDIRRGSILDRHGSVLAVDDPALKTPGHRRYPLGEAVAHTVGYFDPLFGITGVEKAADLELTGIDATVAEDLGRLGRSLIDSKPVEGHDVKLTLDARLQRKCHELLNGKRGAIVALNPANGEILALASAPSFDPLHPGGFYGDADVAPFLNRATLGRYPAGSTFKVAMAAFAADLRLAPHLDCPGEGFRAAKDAQPIRDVEYYLYKRNGAVWHGFGKIGLKQALVHSSNVYFAQLAHKIPAASFNKYVSRCGITEQQLLFAAEGGEVRMLPGLVPEVTDADKKMRSQLAIGQGKMAVSPLHVAMWTAIVANHGLAAPPHLDFGRNPEHLKPRRVVSAAAADNVRDMMRSVVREGTGKNAEVPGAGVCGKTGTAQVPTGEDHSWFTCFTTETTPRLVVTVIVEHGGFGSKAALPVAKSVVEEAIRIGVVRKNGGGAK
jgi:peptidoglycan glycosyltransferase